MVLQWNMVGYLCKIFLNEKIQFYHFLSLSKCLLPNYIPVIIEYNQITNISAFLTREVINANCIPQIKDYTSQCTMGICMYILFGFVHLIPKDEILMLLHLNKRKKDRKNPSCTCIIYLFQTKLIKGSPERLCQLLSKLFFGYNAIQKQSQCAQENH